MSRRQGPTAFSCIGLTLLCWGSPAAAQEAPADSAAGGPEVSAVRFVGAHALPAQLLRQAIHTQASSCRSPFFVLLCRIGNFAFAERRHFLDDSSVVALDAERLATLYEIWGFPRASVHSAIVPQSDAEVVVEFTITEGAPLTVGQVAVQWDPPLEPPLRLPALPLETGQPYALPRLEATERLLRERLADRGYPHAAIEVTGTVDEAAQRAVLTLIVQPGARAVFGPVTIETQSPLEAATIRERLPFRAGDVFSPARLETAERRLYGLPIVARAVVQAASASAADTVVQTHVLVEPRRQRALEVEGAVSSTDCVEAGAIWQDRYFAGGPRVLSIGVTASGLLAAQRANRFPCTATGRGPFARVNGRAQLELLHPLRGGANNILRVRAFQERQSVADVYLSESVGGDLTVGHAVHAEAVVSLGYAPQRSALAAVDVYFCGSYGVCTTEAVSRLSARRWIAPLQLTVVWSTPGYGRVVRPRAAAPLDWTPPRAQGWQHSVRAGGEWAGALTGSDVAFRRAVVEAVTERTLRGPLVVAARVRAGWLAGQAILPPQLMLYSGGAGTVRGVPQNLVGPKVLVADSPPCAPAPCTPDAIEPRYVAVRATGGDRVLEGSVEARYALGIRFQVAAFMDYGRLSRSGAMPAGASSQAAFTPGIGIRVNTDLGPIRLDLGYDPGGARRYPLYYADADGVHEFGVVTYDPYRWDDPGFLRELRRRLQLHMAIGQPF